MAYCAIEEINKLTKKQSKMMKGQIKHVMLIAALWMTTCGVGMAQNDVEQTEHMPVEIKSSDDTHASSVKDFFPDSVSADDENHMLDEVEVKTHSKPLLTRIVDGVSEFFMGCDTNYVTPQKYQMTAQMELSYWHDYYFLRSSETGNTMVIQSDPSVILGGYVYYSILGYGASWNLNDLGITAGKTNGTSLRQTFMIHTAKIFAEYYTFNSGKGAEIRSVSNLDLRGKSRTFHGLDSRCRGVSAVYMFNNRHFSWPAAFGENAVQRKSCGSWSIGFQYNHQAINFDKEALPSYIKDHIDSTLLFTRVNYDDFSANIGYSYNWVLGRNILFASSLMPCLGYRRSNITEAQNEEHSILNNISTDLNVRLALTWNNTRIFSGLMLEAHTYSYRKNKFGLTNTYGTLKYVLGFNFWRKPTAKVP